MAEPFEKLFGDTSELRVIESLIPKRNYNFNVTEIAEESDISRQAAIPVVRKFLEWGLIELDSKHGNANYYKVNEESSFIKAFKDINKDQIKMIIGDQPRFAPIPSSQPPCELGKPSFTVVAQSSITGLGSIGPENIWKKVDTLQISMTTTFSTPKTISQKGEACASAA